LAQPTTAPSDFTSERSANSRLFFEYLAAAAITLLALAVLLNGSLLSAWNANHVDISINLVAADALWDGVDPYGTDTLVERAESLGSPTDLVYSQLFTSYIQPPTSALPLLPLIALPWRDATQLFLVLNHVFLAAAVAITLYTLRPVMPARWVIAGAAVVLAAYAQINASVALGQVDAALLLLLSVAFWAYVRGIAPLAGGAIALAAAIKIIPILVLLYFLWKREYRTALWCVGVGLALFLASLAFASPGIWGTYLTEMLPALLKGSTHYTNAGIGAAITRWFAPETVGGIPDVLSLSELPYDASARLVRTVTALCALIFMAALVRPGLERKKAGDLGRLFLEFYLVVTVALLLSSVNWEFYVILLLPVFLAVVLAPERVLPRGPVRWLAPAGFALALFALNYPADCGASVDCYLFAPNDLFYHPGGVPSVWLERQVGLYANHLDAVLYLRLAGLLLFTGVLASLLLLMRADANRARLASQQQAASGSDN
jgi:Glycosyltransferase family 87